MVIGTTLLKLSGQAYYSPSFPRGGLAATFAVDVTQFDGVTSFDITVQHRNDDETSFSDAGAFTGITATGQEDYDVTGLKQIIRFKYAFTGGNPANGVHFVMQAPSWRPYP